MTHLIEPLGSEGLKHYQSRIDNQLTDIKMTIMTLNHEKNRWKSFEEMGACKAQMKITFAQRKIRDLQKEIEDQEEIIREEEEIISSFKKHDQLEKNTKGKGRPAQSEYNASIAKKFVSQWVKSLMEALDVKSCQKLEELICAYTTILKFNPKTNKREVKIISSRATERNWRRWLKGEAVLNYNTFIILLSTKIDFGKCKGQLLQDVPTTPNSDDLQTLLRFV